mmetsp:Transcript_63465/g.175936  ORF Transcript_63465/g.175936 Transcript_63465/m.175936 type:complete len:221 (+) Transcript_63465:230-892(+)
MGAARMSNWALYANACAPRTSVAQSTKSECVAHLSTTRGQDASIARAQKFKHDEWQRPAWVAAPRPTRRCAPRPAREDSAGHRATCPSCPPTSPATTPLWSRAPSWAMAKPCSSPSCPWSTPEGPRASRTAIPRRSLAGERLPLPRQMPPANATALRRPVRQRRCPPSRPRSSRGRSGHRSQRVVLVWSLPSRPLLPPRHRASMSWRKRRPQGFQEPCSG